VVKKSLKSENFFLPLLDDWFIRPLYFVEQLGDNALQKLSSAIFSFMKNGRTTALIRLTPSEVAMLVTYMVQSKADVWSEVNLK